MSDPFIDNRSLLFTVAYEMLGSAADAEDVVQEVWLRWADLGEAGRAEVREPRAYLVRMVTRQALNRLRTLVRRREDYVGEWLPEPLLTSASTAEDLELAESISFAMLTVLETLGPIERAVFVLREVFDMSYEEIAEAVGKSGGAVRQIAHRARERVAARRPRVKVSHGEQREVVGRFVAALTTGDVQALMNVLAPDVVMVADGGGLVPSIRKPIEGRQRVLALLSRFAEFAPGAAITRPLVNGAPAARIDAAGEQDTVITFVIENDRITHLYAIRNPRKLSRMETEAELRRR